MIIRCTKCSTEFALDPSQVGAEGVTLRCSVCSHMFHAEPDPDVQATPWRVNTADRHSLTLPDLRRVLEQVEDGRLRPDDQLSHTGQTWIRLGEMPEFSSLFIGVEGLPRVFKAVEAAPPVPEPHHGDDVRREETVRVRVQTLAGQGFLLDPLPDPPDFASVVPEAPPHRHLTQEFVSRGTSEALPAPPDFGRTSPSGSHRSLGSLVGGPQPAESGSLPAPPDFGAGGRPDTRPHDARPHDARPHDTRPRKPPPASMLEAVTKVVVGKDGDDEPDAPGADASRTRSQPILVADLARAAAAHTEKTVQAVEGQRAREKAARGEPEPSMRPPASDSSSGGRAATAAAVTAAMAIARDAPSRPHAAPRINTTERAPIDPSPRVTERFPAEPRPAGIDRAAAVVDRSAAAPAPEPSRAVEAPRPEPSVVAVSQVEAPVVPRPPEVVIVKVAEPTKGGSGALVALLGVAAAVAVVFGVPSIREKVFSLGQPTVITKAEPTKAPPPAVPTEEFKLARAAIRTLGLKETNKTQTALQKIVDDAKRAPAAIAQARQLLAELLLTRALACQIAVAIEPSAMGGEAQARSVEDPPAARDLLATLGADADPEAQARITALQAIVAGQSPTLAPGNDELSAIVRAAPLWRGQIKTPPTGLITSLQRLPTPSTLSQSLLGLALVRSGDEAGAREILLEILQTVPDQPVARTLLDVLDRQGMMNDQGDPEVAPDGETPPVLPTDPRPTSDPGKSAPRTIATSEQIETMISAGCQKVRAGDPDGVKVLLDAIQRGAKPTGNFNLSFCLGNGFARQGSHDTAFTWYSRAVDQSPSNRDALAGAARSAELLGRTSVAVELYKKLRALEPGNAAAGAYLSKHDQPDDPAPVPPTDDPGELMPIKPKLK